MPIIRKLFNTVVFGTLIGWIGSDHLVSLGYVHGNSMQPLNPSQWLLIRKFGYYGSRGDLVVLRDPEEQGESIIKRVVAVENDVLKYNDQWIKIPKGQCWIQGLNNKVKQRDSSQYGPVPMSLIEGKVEAVIWPWNQVAWLSHPSWNSGKQSPQLETLLHMSQQGLEAGKEMARQVGEAISPSEDDGKKDKKSNQQQQQQQPDKNQHKQETQQKLQQLAPDQGPDPQSKKATDQEQQKQQQQKQNKDSNKQKDDQQSKQSDKPKQQSQQSRESNEHPKVVSPDDDEDPKQKQIRRAKEVPTKDKEQQSQPVKPKHILKDTQDDDE